MSDQNLPENIVEGELARLIPIAKDSEKERKATSVLLAGLMSVSEFARKMLSSIGAPATKTIKVACYTEVVFKSGLNKESFRPDGLIVVTVGSRTWKALVEAKVGSAVLETKQIEDYLDLARKYGVDAVVTISNQFAALPTHNPVRVNGNKTRSVSLYHWSWSSLLSEAIMLKDYKGVSDPEQAYIMTEMIRYLNNPASGVLSAVRMRKSWKNLCEDIRDNNAVTLANSAVCEVVEDWHQIGRYLALELSTVTGVSVAVAMKTAHKTAPQARAQADFKELQSNKNLYLELDVPGAAGRLYIHADMERRVLEASMWLRAPNDASRSSTCVTWLTRQLAGCKDEKVIVRVEFRKPSLNKCALLTTAREEPKILLPNDLKIMPSGFIISRVSDNVTRFMGPKTFVEDIRDLVVNFYASVGENLTAWVPPAPQVKEKKRIDEPKKINVAQQQAAEDKGVLRGLLNKLPLH